MKPKVARWAQAPLLALALAQPALAAQVAVTPVLPTYGQAVTVELRDTQWPIYLPATRYMRVGSTIVIDYEYATDGFGPRRADFGQAALSLGELAPGNYTLEARMFKMDDPGVAPQVVTQTLAVVPPEKWGIYTVPQEPEAFAPADAMIRSAVYFEPGSMQVTVNGNVIRVDFDYRGDAPVGGPIPPGTTSFAAARMPSLGPGTYTVEGWGREKSNGLTERYFSRQFTIASAVPVVEYYAESTDHYFITASPREMAMLDSGAMGGWKRTGQKFKGWLRMGDGPPNAKPVCRFYARGPNSHFYTGNPGDCEYLKAIEQQQRADSQAKGHPFLGWAFESIAFYALLPENGQCAGPTSPVYRAYNNRAAHNDSNHRFTADSRQRAAMAMDWIDEGIAFCSPA